jgi:hypothetical protein
MKLTEKIMNALNDECGIRYKSKIEQDVFLFGARRALEEYAKGLWHGADEQPAINSEVIIFAKKVLPSGQRVAPTYAAVYRDVMGRDVCLFTDIDIKADILRWINVEDLP